MMEKNRLTIFAKTKFWLVVLLFPLFCVGQEYLDLPNPTHFEAGVPRSKLVLVKEIPLDFNENEFMANPIGITANSKGMIYIFDSKLVRVFLFNNRYEYVTQFLEKGMAPSEILTLNGFSVRIYAGWNEKFYSNDCYSNKFIEFSESGKYLLDKRVNRNSKTLTPFFFVVDKHGYFYASSTNGGIVDLMDTQWKLVHTYLKRDLNDHYIIYRPDVEKYYRTIVKRDGTKMGEGKSWLNPTPKNLTFDLLNNNYLFIFLHNSSTVYLFNGKNLVRKFDVLIDNILPTFKEDITRSFNATKKRDPKIINYTYFPLFDSCIVDYDEPYFYLQYQRWGKESMIYQFSITGKLVRIISLPPIPLVRLKAKRNGLFYAIAENTEGTFPVIYKKVD